jgi:hypothetical protein
MRAHAHPAQGRPPAVHRTMSLETEFRTLWQDRRAYGLPSERREQAFRMFPPTHRPAHLNTAEALAERNTRHVADAAGQIQQAYVCEHLLVGEPPHQGHALRFTYADGTTQYFAPHKA